MLNKLNMKKFNLAETTNGVLITKYTKSAETPYCFVINDKEGTIPQVKGKTSYYRYNILCYGKLTSETDFVYLTYNIQDPGGCFVPSCCFVENSDAEDFLKYWNDDAGVMATGKYFFKEKTKILK